MPKSVVIISGIFPPDPGGPAKFAREFATWSSRHGVRTNVIAYGTENRSTLLNADGELHTISRKDHVFFRYIRMIRAICESEQKVNQIFAVGAFLETYLASILKNFRYVAKVPGDIVWERARNNKDTSLEIDAFQDSDLPIKYRLFRFMFTRSLKRATLVIVPSDGLFRLCIRWGIPSHRLRLIRNSIDLPKFSGVKRASFRFDVLTVCRLAPWKGVQELIEVCSKLNLNLAIAGDGPERTNLEQLSIKLDLNAKFFGDISELEILELLSISKIFVLNSYYEGLPHALVEARAAGLICVARDGTGSAEVIHDGEDGYLVGKMRNLTEAIIKAVDEFDSFGPMGRLASQDAHARFDRERNFEKISLVLEEQ